jgi:hypothetical protein
MEERLHDKQEERVPFLWSMVALIVGVSAIFLWRWYVS